MFKEVASPETVVCYHCGELCEDELIAFDDKSFCCNGCKMVFEILNENDLCDYYELQNSPGIQLKNKAYDQKFSYLDNAEIQKQLLNFSSQKLSKITFFVPAIHCSSCIWLLEHLDRLRQGVVQSRVNFVRKEVSLDFNPEVISLKTIVELLATLGYEPELNLQKASKSKTKKENRALYLKIGLAGFGFGNIMLLSFPEYFGFEGLDSSVRRFISLVNILISLPVVFYSASGYFVSAYKGLRQKFINIDVPITIGIAALFIRSLYEIISEAGPGYLDSLAGLIFFLLIGKWFQSRTYESLSFERDYKSYFPLAISRIEGANDSQMVQITKLKEDDVIEVRNQEIIPADAELLSHDASIDYSFVTGEADTIQKQEGDYIYAGGRQVGSTIRLRIKKAVSQSYLTQLWNNDAFNEPSTYDSLIDKISKYFTLVVLFIAVFAALYWFYNDPHNILNAFTAVLIVACPCALSLATPFTLGNTMTILGRHKIYLKHMNVIEKLWNITTIVFDKTGTLTRNKTARLQYSGKELSTNDKQLIANIAMHSTHPLSRMLVDILPAQKTNERVKDFLEVEGQGVKGILDNKLVSIGSSSFTGGNRINSSIETTQVHIKIDEYKGYFSIQSTYRTGLAHMVKVLLRKYKLSILSGDNSSEENNLKKIFTESASYSFNQKPDQKLSYIKNKQEVGEQVLMLGDGLNDAGALKQSDVGFAVTEDVTAFTPACDAILYGQNLTSLNTYLAFARLSKRVILVSFTISFIYNLVGMALAVSANITPLYAAILMPLSSITVVAFATFAVRLVAFRLKLL